MSRARVVVVGIAAALAVVGLAWALVGGVDRVAACGEGFVHRGNRCLPERACPAPLVTTPAGCDGAEHDVVEVPAARLVVGPSDWEAEGKVAPRTITTGPFAIDRLEVTVGAVRRLAPELAPPSTKGEDAARALSAVTLDEARAICAKRGGRLPTEDEWIVAAAGARGSRYPWGDTGAVCRRAAWGLFGTCGLGGGGPDTVGAHPEGKTPSGIFDLAGNVAEWVEPVEAAVAVEPVGEARTSVRPGFGVVKGGSWGSTLATELRTWSRREVRPGERERTIGFRCAYDRGVGSKVSPEGGT